MPAIHLRSSANFIVLFGLALPPSIMLAAGPALAQSAAITAIDTAQHNCLDHAQSDTEMQRCLTASEAAYDAELNKSFKEAIEALDPGSTKLLRDAQRQWLVAREADRKVWRGSWRATAGTMANGAADDVEAGRTRQRAIELGILVQSVKG